MRTFDSLSEREILALAISLEEAEVNAFLAGPLCFPQLQPASFASFLAAAPRLADPSSLRGVRARLPIYPFSGSDDLIGQQLAGVEVLVELSEGRCLRPGS